jgi:hypothetical protein
MDFTLTQIQKTVVMAVIISYFLIIGQSGL